MHEILHSYSGMARKFETAINNGEAINLSMSLNSLLTFVLGVATVATIPSEWRNVHHYEDDVRNR